ncbi:hypothetical protein MLD38_008910 [Melastoma candidum]|uniref:Uncharacterized protein n=1 Tax=Melastoma candidum TaxID=119954 RepID=A0ACB9S070_9MYRT|nr:hypothetical protein MLD38_008910 [Melastoma candidum]
MASSSWNTSRCIGKRFASQIWTNPLPPPLPNPLLPLRRVATASVYDKNPEDHNPHTVVSDEVIKTEADKYWAPHPQTGVFGPASGHKTAGLDTKAANAGDSSALEQSAWFRPTSLEDLEKPLQS